MGSDKRKIVNLVLSIQHTGTFFASKTLAASFPQSHFRIGSLYEKHKKMGHTKYVEKGAIELSDFYPPVDEVPEDFNEKMVLPVCSKNDLEGKDIVIGHEHFHKPGSWILKALKEAPARCPIVIPVRDPLLSLHSKIWREIEQHNNKDGIKEKHRRNRLKRWIALYKDILSIPKGHVFHLPVDAVQSQTEESRIKIIKDMYEYCGLPFGYAALEQAKGWKPTNRTYNVIKKDKNKTPAACWEDFKEKYLKGDINHTKAIMGLEFEGLREDKELIELMKKVGYEDVLWW